MSKDFQIRPAIHFPIDVQMKFYNGLSEEWSREFPRRIAKFSNELRKLDIETIPVATSTFVVDSGYYKKPFPEVFSALPNNTEKNFFRALSFGPEYFPDASNAVFVKDDMNAFARGPLAEMIKQKSIKTVLITGMNTTECVAQSVVGAFRKSGENVCIKVVYDLLAGNVGNSIKTEDNPLSHKAAIEKEICRILAQREQTLPPRISLVLAAKTLKFFSRWPKFLPG